MTREEYIRMRKIEQYDAQFIFNVWNTYSGRPQSNINMFIQILQIKLFQSGSSFDELLKYITRELDVMFNLTFFKNKEGEIINIF